MPPQRPPTSQLHGFVLAPKLLEIRCIPLLEKPQVTLHFLILCLTDVKEFCNIWFFSWALKGPHIANAVTKFAIIKN